MFVLILIELTYRISDPSFSTLQLPDGASVITGIFAHFDVPVHNGSVPVCFLSEKVSRPVPQDTVMNRWSRPSSFEHSATMTCQKPPEFTFISTWSRRIADKYDNLLTAHSRCTDYLDTTASDIGKPAWPTVTSQDMIYIIFWNNTCTI